MLPGAPAGPQAPSPVPAPALTATTVVPRRHFGGMPGDRGRAPPPISRGASSCARTSYTPAPPRPTAAAGRNPPSSPSPTYHHRPTTSPALKAEPGARYSCGDRGRWGCPGRSPGACRRRRRRRGRSRPWRRRWLEGRRAGRLGGLGIWNGAFGFRGEREGGDETEGSRIERRLAKLIRVGWPGQVPVPVRAAPVQSSHSPDSATMYGQIWRLVPYACSPLPPDRKSVV